MMVGITTQPQLCSRLFSKWITEFITKILQGDRIKPEIQRNLTPQAHKQLFSGKAIKRQMELFPMIHVCIVVATGPGSGKTILVLKLASLLLLEDVKRATSDVDIFKGSGY